MNRKEEQFMQHSGVGRISTIIMRPMSLFESLDSNGTISLNSLFNGEKVAPAVCDKKLLDNLEPHTH